jgi:hypothetical protein
VPPRKLLGASLAAVVFFPALLLSGPSAPAPAWWSVGTQPQPLSAAEEASPAIARLARRYNPAMALSDGSIWPIDVRYAWRDGAHVVGEVMDGGGRVVERHVAVKNRDLERRPWNDLPAQDARGRRIRYIIDAPGDDREVAPGQSGWRARWEALVGPSPQQLTGAGGQRFRPTQYAHAFWIDRKQRLLGIQYWFFYPFNEWINRHEGDWEHINVVLKGQGPPGEDPLGDGAGFRPVGYQFAFHGWRLETSEVVRVAGPEPADDHVVVFVGGRSRLLWWRGKTSGGSYPLPAVYQGAGSGPLSPSEDTRVPERFIAARDFDVILLPEPERLDAKARPELSWLALDFYAGQARVFTNPPLIDWLGYGGPVRQPAVRPAWNARRGKRRFPHAAQAIAARPALPADWSLLAAPWPRRPARDGALVANAQASPGGSEDLARQEIEAEGAGVGRPGEVGPQHEGLPLAQPQPAAEAVLQTGRGAVEGGGRAHVGP